ncbi:UDP-glucuronosyltransferase 2B18-like [Sitophilus oryzae]|uniref:UDP-glucuronosyltransferase n=1 Tax=Sitophilus oryzae TaxID=7048 RepID=A0A6J2YKB0_SITOR|nr:UDP-glucuronosyltransferase 2B18-like [Sitophilus oryzae]
MILLLLFGWLLLTLGGCDSARILCIFPVPSVSHQATFQPIAKALSLRGHDVISVTPSPLKDPTLTNLTEIDTSYTKKILLGYGFEYFMSKEVAIQNKIPKIFEMYYELAEALFQNEEFKKIYTNPDEKFDLIIAQIYISPIMLGLSVKLNAPIIGVSSMGCWIGTHYAMGNPILPSMYSEMFLPYHGELSFYERIKSTLYFLWSRYYVNLVALPKCDQISKKYLGNDIPYIGDIEKNLSALFLNSNPVLYTPRPLVPTVVPLVFIHIEPPKPLPQDIKAEMDSAKNGVVYFSLGSNVKSMNIPQRVRNLLMDVFRELPYKVLWKFEKEELPGKPSNVVIKQWLPQQDVLAHPNVKVFVSQGGLQSTEEAVDRGVPMVIIPFISDQEFNGKKLQEFGVARHIDYLNTTKQELIDSIIDVAKNPKYRENMKKLKDLLNDEPMTGIERAVWWSEYVIRHKGTRHLRSPTVDIAWYKYFLLDVVSAFVGIIILILVVLIKLFKYVKNSLTKKEKIKTK